MKRVDPKVYTKDYYLTDCSGYQEFRKNWGQKLEPRFKRIIQKIPLKPKMKVLDIGCGRGELSFWAAQKGAQTIGIDYSKSAINLAKTAKTHQPLSLQKKVKFQLKDAKQMTFPFQSFDVVFLVEVLEHLYPHEQEEIFKKINKILKPNGFVFIHTAPSRWFNDFTYKFWCYPVSSLLVGLWNLITRSHYPNILSPKNIRTKSHKIMHINEPNYFALKHLFKKHHLYGSIRSTNITVNKNILSWKDRLFNLVVYLHPLSNYFPFNILWGNDFLAVLRKK